jgi:hypothetical protein
MEAFDRDGLTRIDRVAGCEPLFPAMEPDLALDVDRASVAGCPDAIVDGPDMKLLIAGSAVEISRRLPAKTAWE